MTLTKKIIIYMIVGAVVGIIINTTGLMESPFVGGKLVGGVFYVVGKVFLYSLQMLVVPLVFVSLFAELLHLKIPPCWER